MRIITQSEKRPQCSLVNYAVDAAGNLRTVSGGGHIVSYSYGDPTWADLLTGVTLNGVHYDISYTTAGNPSNWFNDTVYENLT